MKKSVWKLLSAGVLAGVLLTGCGNTDTASGSTTSDSTAIAESAKAEETTTATAANTENEADDELAQIQKNGVLRVGVEGTYPPMTYHDEDGKLTGFDVEVAEKIAEKLGVTAEFTESGWDSLLAGIDSGRLDTVINAVSITDEREIKYDFAGPYFYITQQIVVAADDDSITDMDSLKGKKVANTVTTAYMDILEEAGAELVPISTAEEAASLITSGRADFTTFNSVVFNEYLTQHPEAGLKAAFDIPDVIDTYAVPVKKGETRLHDAIQQALDELSQEGVLTELSIEYFGKDFTQPIE